MFINQKEWQVEVYGEIYEATFEELQQWISEGAVLPTDKVKRENLRWIPAEKAPELYSFINSDNLNLNPPVIFNIDEIVNSNQSKIEDWGINFEKVCHLHKERDYAFACDICEHYFCISCPKSYGGNVRICPLCDSMCRSVDEPVNTFKTIGAVNKPYLRVDKIPGNSEKRSWREIMNPSKMLDYSSKYIKSIFEEGKVHIFSIFNKTQKR